MTEQDREDALISQLTSGIKSEIREMYLKYGDFSTAVIYTSMCMELCALAISDGLSAHDLMEGVLKTYRMMEKQHEHQDLNPQGQ